MTTYTRCADALTDNFLKAAEEGDFAEFEEMTLIQRISMCWYIFNLFSRIGLYKRRAIVAWAAKKAKDLTELDLFCSAICRFDCDHEVAQDRRLEIMSLSVSS